jgi:hypothetical protein
LISHKILRKLGTEPARQKNEQSLPAKRVRMDFCGERSPDQRPPATATERSIPPASLARQSIFLEFERRHFD